ncbi:hypothetical protein ACHAWF_008676 [Thalassiosira exigua]
MARSFPVETINVTAHAHGAKHQGENHEGQRPPAFPGAKHDVKGFCIRHPNVRLCEPVPAREAKDGEDGEPIKYRPVRKICQKCGVNVSKRNEKRVPRSNSRGNASSLKCTSDVKAVNSELAENDTPPRIAPNVKGALLQRRCSNGKESEQKGENTPAVKGESDKDRKKRRPDQGRNASNSNANNEKGPSKIRDNGKDEGKGAGKRLGRKDGHVSRKTKKVSDKDMEKGAADNGGDDVHADAHRRQRRSHREPKRKIVGTETKQMSEKGGAHLEKHIHDSDRPNHTVENEKHADREGDDLNGNEQATRVFMMAARMPSQDDHGEQERCNGKNNRVKGTSKVDSEKTKVSHNLKERSKRRSASAKGAEEEPKRPSGNDIKVERPKEVDPVSSGSKKPFHDKGKMDVSKLWSSHSDKVSELSVDSDQDGRRRNAARHISNEKDDAKARGLEKSTKARGHERDIGENKDKKTDKNLGSESKDEGLQRKENKRHSSTHRSARRRTDEKVQSRGRSGDDDCEDNRVSQSRNYKRSKSLPQKPQRKRVPSEYHVPSKLTTYREEFLQEMAHLSVHVPSQICMPSKAKHSNG